MYVSLPMAGRTAEDIGSDLEIAIYSARQRGYEPIVPTDCNADHEPCPVYGRRIQPEDKHTIQCYMREDIKALLDCDMIMMMPGWEISSGCNIELLVANQCGIGVFFYGV